MISHNYLCVNQLEQISNCCCKRIVVHSLHFIRQRNVYFFHSNAFDMILYNIIDLKRLVTPAQLLYCIILLDEYILNAHEENMYHTYYRLRHPRLPGGGKELWICPAWIIVVSFCLPRTVLTLSL